APVFKTIAQQALAYLGIEGNLPKTGGPTIVPLAQREREPSAQPRLQQIADVPTAMISRDGTVITEANFLGMSLREAVLAAQRNDWQITTQGSGYVVKQTVTYRSGKPVYALTLAPTNEAQP